MITCMSNEQPTISGEVEPERGDWYSDEHDYEQCQEPRQTIQEYLSVLEQDMSTRLNEIKEEIEKKKYELRKPEVLPYMREKHLTEMLEYETFVSDLERELEELRAPKNTKEISTENGDFRIVYEAHEEPNSEGVLRNLDAYAKEFAMHFSSATQSTVPPTESGGPFGRDAFADGLLYLAIRESGMPVYFCDVFPGDAFFKKIDNEHNRIKFLRFLEQIASPAVGMGVGFYTLTEMKKNKEKKKEGIYTRRDFCKIAGLGAAAVGLFGGVAGGIIEGSYGTKLGVGESRPVDEHSFLRTMYKKRNEILDMVGIQNILTVLRNAVMAQKLHTIAERMKKNGEYTGEKPHVGIEIGAAHSGIEDMLTMTEEERLQIIGDIAESIKDVFEDPQKEIAAILKTTYDPEDKKWRVQRALDKDIVYMLQERGLIHKET
jgi:hypothetical protein